VLKADALTALVQHIEAGTLDPADSLVTNYVVERVRNERYYDHVEFHNAVYHALAELRRILSDEIPPDERSMREALGLRRITSERSVAVVRRNVRRALEAERM